MGSLSWIVPVVINEITKVKRRKREAEEQRRYGDKHKGWSGAIAGKEPWARECEWPQEADKARNGFSH